MTYNNCYGCFTKDNLIQVEDNRGRLYPMCKKCLKKKEVDNNE